MTGVQTCALPISGEGDDKGIRERNANGVSQEVLKLANERVIIPMLGKTESLNASIAASIMIYEYVRQKIQK